MLKKFELALVKRAPFHSWSCFLFKTKSFPIQCFNYSTQCKNRINFTEQKDRIKIFDKSLLFDHKKNTNKSCSLHKAINKYSFCEKNNKVDSNENKKTEEKPKSYYKQIKDTFKKYGKKGLILYSILYVGGAVAFYFLVREKYIDVNHQLIREKINIEDLRKKYGEFETNAIIGVILNECLEIPRLLIVIALLKIFVKK